MPAGSCRSVADSLFRPHPDQRARASREPPQSPQSPPSPEQTVEKLHGVGLCTTTGRFGGCGAEPLHRLGSRTRQIGRVRTRPDASGGTKWTQNGEFSNKKRASISQISQIFIENLQFSKKECASISRMLVEKC